MPQIRRSIEIDAPVDEVFAYCRDPNHLLEIWPSVLEVSHVEADEQGHYHYDWVYKLAGTRVHGHADTVELEPNRRIVTRNDGIPSTHRWSFEARGDHTVFTTDIDYELPHSLLSRFAAPFIHKINEHEATVVVENLKARMEARAPQPEPQPAA